MGYVNAFLSSGILCVLAQILFVNTRLGLTKIFTICMVLGVLMSAAGMTQPLVAFGGAGVIVSIMSAGDGMIACFGVLLGGHGTTPLLRLTAMIAGVFAAGIICGLVKNEGKA